MRARWTAAILAVVALAAAAGAWAAWPAPPADDFDASGQYGQRPAAAATIAPITAGVVGSRVEVRSSDPEAALAAAEGPTPVRVEVPAVGIDVTVQAAGLEPDRSLTLPEDGATASWYRHGAVPGDPDRAALIAAHVASRIDGRGPFASLAQVRPGDEVVVTMSDGSRAAFVIVRRERISKSTVDYDAVTAASGGELLLVTCGGEFDSDTQNFDDNVIVWAVPTQVP